MKLRFLFVGIVVAAVAVGVGVWTYVSYSQPPSVSETQDFELSEADSTEEVTTAHPRLQGLDTWQRPVGPFRVGLQVGHWNAADAPEEQSGLRDNTGTSGGGKREVDVNRTIAELAKTQLEAKGFAVDLLPVTIPPNYFADVFLSIHADGNVNTGVNGYKVAAPRRDYTGRSAAFAELLAYTYGRSTRLAEDPNVSRNMRGYYAFNWRRYEHSIHPMTVAAILETGFLTNAGDRRIIVNQPELSANAIVEAITKFAGF